MDVNVENYEDIFGRGVAKKVNDQVYLEFSDEYEHVDGDIEYLLENVLMSIPSELTKSYENLADLYNSTINRSCNCANSCADKLVKCLHGSNYCVIKTDNGNRELVLNKTRPVHDLIYECNSNCSCESSMCHNRLVQFGPRKHLKIINCLHLNDQLGLITTQAIPEGAFICEYAGEILTKSEALKRHSLNSNETESMNYIICLNEYSIQINESADGHSHIQTFVDPTQRGSIGRYLNHSCDPNCEILSVRIDSILPKLGIFAKRNIAIDEELCFDYGDNCDSNESSSDRKVIRKKCFCGSQKCRFYLPNNIYSDL